ncbi:MAG: hypothetical protein DRQ39_09900, partial [Gammaproteobacteria bacterium]
MAIPEPTSQRLHGRKGGTTPEWAEAQNMIWDFNPSQEYLWGMKFYEFDIKEPNKRVVYQALRTVSAGIFDPRDIQGGSTANDYWQVAWAAENSRGRMVGWMDATKAGGGDDCEYDVVNTDSGASIGDYVIVEYAGRYNLADGRPNAAGEYMYVGDRVIFHDELWVVMDADRTLMRGWFDPTIAGGGADLIEPTHPIVDGNVDYERGMYVIALQDGDYDVTTGQPVPLGTGTPIQQGDRLLYTGTQWVLLDSSIDYHRGWFDPAVDCGNGIVPSCVIDNDATGTYRNGDYVISVGEELYNFRLGQTDPTNAQPDTVSVGLGDRCIYNGTTWTVVPVSDGLMKGWFNPQINGGGGLVEYTVVNSSTLYIPREYVISRWQGNYDFALGVADPSGTPVEAGDSFMFNGTTWELLIENQGLMRGWFNPTIANGFGDVPWSITDTNTAYRIGEYIIAEEEGNYDFVTGAPIAAPAGKQVNNGDIWRFTATGWELVNSDTEGLSKGWLDATAASGGANVPFHPINGTTEYEEDEYLICLVEGDFDFTIGEPVAVGVGVRVKVGDRIRYDGLVWTVIPQDNSLMKG